MAWNPSLATLLDDAITVVDAPDRDLLEQLPRSSPPSPAQLVQLRVACMHLICGVLTLEGVQKQELMRDDPPAGATPPAPAPAAPAAPAPAATASAAEGAAAGSGGGGGGGGGEEKPAAAAGEGGAAGAAEATAAAAPPPPAEPEPPKPSFVKRKLTLLLLK